MGGGCLWSRDYIHGMHAFGIKRLADDIDPFELTLLHESLSACMQQFNPLLGCLQLFVARRLFPLADLFGQSGHKRLTA